MSPGRWLSCALTASLLACQGGSAAPRAAQEQAQAQSRSQFGPGLVRGFEQAAEGAAPAGFTAAARGGPSGRWVVRARDDAPEGRQVVVQEDGDPTDSRFALLIDDADEHLDLRLSVRCRAVSGQVDQGVGLVFRLRDPDNYYLTRANAIEDNVRLYRVKGGHREQLASWDGPIEAGSWNTLAVEARAEHLAVSWNGQQVIATTDSGLRQPGRVGLWTKADSISEFDALTVQPAAR